MPLTHVKFDTMELLEYKRDVLHGHGNLGNLIHVSYIPMMWLFSRQTSKEAYWVGEPCRTHIFNVSLVRCSSDGNPQATLNGHLLWSTSYT